MKLNAVILTIGQLLALSATIPAIGQPLSSCYLLGDCYVRQVPCYVRPDGSYYCKVDIGFWMRVEAKDAFRTAKEAIKEFYVREDLKYGKKAEGVIFYTYNEKASLYRK